MRGCCGRNEDSFSTTVFQAILRVCKELDRRWKIGSRPFGSTWLGVARGNEFDARLLKCKNTCTDDTKAPEANKSDSESALSGHCIHPRPQDVVSAKGSDLIRHGFDCIRSLGSLKIAHGLYLFI